MKYLNTFFQKINENILSDRIKNIINNIISYILKNSSLDIYDYDEIWYIQKNNEFLSGKLYLSLKSSKAIRINWIKNDISNRIHSIDLWEDFKFDSNPKYTLDINRSSVISILSDILSFIKSPKNILKEELDTTSGYDPRKELMDAEKRLKRLKSPKSIEIQQRKIDQLKSSIAYDENSEIESQKINQTELKIDVFKSIELYTIQVARGKSNSLIVSGDPGVGKTQVIKDTLTSLGMKKDVNYYFATGTATTAGLYEILFKNRKILIVFDDCDAVFKEPDSVNLLKGALDTYEVREISKLSKGNTFDSTGMDDAEIQQEYEKTNKLPNKFEFIGQIIFVSNLPESKFDGALLSRALHIDVQLNKKELLDRMNEVLKKICPNVDMDKKKEALEYLTHITNSYSTKFDMNIRTLIHSINLRANNEEYIKFGDVEEAVWKLLIKKYLIKEK